MTEYFNIKNKEYIEIDRNQLILNITKEFSTGTGVEVGTFKGEYSKHILNIWNGTLYMVDVWRPLDNYIDSNNHSNFENGVYSECIKNTSGFEHRSSMIRADSKLASKIFQDKSLDFVYIDANHSYDYVKEDIELWYPKIKSDGYLLGHDYIHTDWSQEPYCENNIDKHIYFPNAYDPNGELYYCGEFGVNPAVNEFCVKNNYKVKITNEYWGTWIIKKK